MILFHDLAICRRHHTAPPSVVPRGRSQRPGHEDSHDWERGTKWHLLSQPLYSWTREDL